MDEQSAFRVPIELVVHGRKSAKRRNNIFHKDILFTFIYLYLNGKEKK